MSETTGDPLVVEESSSSECSCNYSVPQVPSKNSLSLPESCRKLDCARPVYPLIAPTKLASVHLLAPPTLSAPGYLRTNFNLKQLPPTYGSSNRLSLATSYTSKLAESIPPSINGKRKVAPGANDGFSKKLRAVDQPPSSFDTEVVCVNQDVVLDYIDDLQDQFYEQLGLLKVCIGESPQHLSPSLALAMVNNFQGALLASMSNCRLKLKLLPSISGCFDKPPIPKERTPTADMDATHFRATSSVNSPSDDSDAVERAFWQIEEDDMMEDELIDTTFSMKHEPKTTTEIWSPFLVGSFWQAAQERLDFYLNLMHIA